MTSIEKKIRQGDYYDEPNGVAVVKTTFWLDFGIAEMDGVEGVRETYKRAFDEWKDSIEYMTALCIVLNHKIWERYNKLEPSEFSKDELAKTYDRLWGECDSYILDNFNDDGISYFLSATD